MSEVTPADNLSQLGAQWSAAQVGTSTLVWRFAQSLLGFATANQSMKLAEIGAELGRAAKRAAPYSKTWVSRAIKAAKTFTTEPQSEEDASRFLDAFYGNETRTERKAKARAAKTTPTAEDALKTAVFYARRAVKLGMNAELVTDTIADELGTEAAPDTTAQALNPTTP